MTDLWTELGFGEPTARHLGVVLVRLLVAAALGAAVAYRPWRRLIGHLPPIPPETAQAQTLIAVAGAIMVAVIGDSMARAFGLVGLGAFIRFRSGIKDPRDAAVMFVMIGVGMACGLGLVPVAVGATAFAAMVLALFDAVGKARPSRARLVILVDDPRARFAAVRAAFPEARVLALPATSPEPGKIVLEIHHGRDVDAATILADLEAKGVAGVRSVAFEED